MTRPGPILTRLLRAPAHLYDWHAGWILGVASFASPISAAGPGVATRPCSKPSARTAQPERSS